MHPLAPSHLGHFSCLFVGIEYRHQSIELDQVRISSDRDLGIENTGSGTTMELINRTNQPLFSFRIRSCSVSINFFPRDGSCANMDVVKRKEQNLGT